MPNSIGISFYIAAGTDSFCLDVAWGDYTRTSLRRPDKDGVEHSHAAYARHAMEDTIIVRFSDFEKSTEYRLAQDSNVCVYVSRIPLKNGFSFVTACCMISETACENGNRMLDRGLIVPIADREDQEYFRELVIELCQLAM